MMSFMLFLIIGCEYVIPNIFQVMIFEISLLICDLIGAQHPCFHHYYHSVLFVNWNVSIV